MNDEEILLEDTEILEEEDAEIHSQTVVYADTTVELLTEIRNDVYMILVFTIITFAMACFRGWRKNVIKGVR